MENELVFHISELSHFPMNFPIDLHWLNSHSDSKKSFLRNWSLQSNHVIIKKLLLEIHSDLSDAVVRNHLEFIDGVVFCAHIHPKVFWDLQYQYYGEKYFARERHRCLTQLDVDMTLRKILWLDLSPCVKFNISVTIGNR